jgi:hypothetical protein
MAWFEISWFGISGRDFSIRDFPDGDGWCEQDRIRHRLSPVRLGKRGEAATLALTGR